MNWAVCAERYARCVCWLMVFVLRIFFFLILIFDWATINAIFAQNVRASSLLFHWKRSFFVLLVNPKWEKITRPLFVICIADSSNVLKGNSCSDNKIEQTKKQMCTWGGKSVANEANSAEFTPNLCAAQCTLPILGTNSFWFLFRWTRKITFGFCDSFCFVYNRHFCCCEYQKQMLRQAEGHKPQHTKLWVCVCAVCYVEINVFDLHISVVCDSCRFKYSKLIAYNTERSTATTYTHTPRGIPTDQYRNKNENSFEWTSTTHTHTDISKCI